MRGSEQRQCWLLLRPPIIDALVTAMSATTGLAFVEHAGYQCVRVSHSGGVLWVSLHGAQVLSWIPRGQRDVFWLSPLALPAPAAIRGGVPVCWPWFGKQGMPTGAMQHGPIRNAMWRLVRSERSEAGGFLLSLEPDRKSPTSHTVDLYASHLEVRLDIEVSESLHMTLVTRNAGEKTVALTQALHSYFAIGDATQVVLEGVDGLHFDSRVDGSVANLQRGEFTLDAVCDNTYSARTDDREHVYQLLDPVWKRRITLTTLGSQSLVVWNPGAEGASKMADVPNGAWTEFLCVEAANAGGNVIELAPGGTHQLCQTLVCSAWAT
jgi:glucose-6-phosphate 1-epimerase